MAQGTPQHSQDSSLEVRAGIEIACTTCYVRGVATAELIIDENFNADQALNTTRDSVRDNVRNFTETFEDYLATYIRRVTQNISDGFEWSDLEFPTFPVAFDLRRPGDTGVLSSISIR